MGSFAEEAGSWLGIMLTFTVNVGLFVGTSNKDGMVDGRLTGGDVGVFEGIARITGSVVTNPTGAKEGDTGWGEGRAPANAKGFAHVGGCEGTHVE